IVLEHEIFARPWGFYKTTVLNEMFQGKVIYVSPMQKLSLQSHKRREEYWMIVKGEGTIQLGDSVHPVHPGSTFFIPKCCRHRISNTSENENLMFTEVQLGDYFGEDDIERYEDIYHRA
ncbi:MAG: phosphomannose isomerase type II C-terminal cupin domain, partial [Oscillospiraceae bacterium]|nr:phosphomannose isomerase type II C-terminal cupin domain [Oscillospiraceae bacterium]